MDSNNVSPISTPIGTQPQEPAVASKFTFNIERLNDKAIVTMQTLDDLKNYIINENEAKTDSDFQYNLGFISSELKTKIKQIKSNNHGLFAFFKYLFRPRLKREEEQKIEYMETLKTFIESLNGKLVATPKTVVSEVFEEEEEIPFDELESPITPVSSPAKSAEKTAKVEVATAELEAPVKMVPPSAPPLPGAGGPPPAPSMEMFGKGPKVVLTLAQRQLATRANPLESFYTIQLPLNETKLNQQKTTLENRIETLNAILLKLPDDKTLEQLIQAMQKEVENLVEELKGITVPMKSNSVEFVNKLQNPKKGYTNEELKIILGIAFGGKKPDATHLQYKIYAHNQKLFDNIFNDWKHLSKGEKGKVYLKHTADWKKYLGVNLFGFTSVLRDRLSNKLPEPTNETKPAIPRRGTKLPFTKGNATGDLMAELAGKLPPRFEG